MRVFNLTNSPIVYRGRPIPAAGSFDFTDMTYVPDRDRKLAAAGMLAFGEPPRGWGQAKPAPQGPKADKASKTEEAPLLGEAKTGTESVQVLGYKKKKKY